MNATKRRRLNESNSTLSKPFRSPMRVDVKKSDSPAQSRAAHATPPLSNIASTVDTSSSPPKISSSPGRSLPPPTGHARASLSSPTRFALSRTKPLLNQPRDSEYIVLQKQHSATLLHLSQLRASLDTSQQAVKILSGNNDAELETLILKWRFASREAAEELFCGARDRVMKMGGVGAWRERTWQRSQEGWGDDREGEQNEDGSELTADQREARELMQEEMKADMNRYGGEREEITGEKDDEGFTMDMMLKQLNVPLEVIGYEKESQKWI